MAFYKRDIIDINLETGNIHRSYLKHSIGTGDNQADQFGIRTFRDGTPVDLTGVSCQGVFRDPQGNNIALTSHGTVSGNMAYLTLPQACYNYEGQFTLSIKLVGGGVTGTMRIVDGMVDNTHTGGAVAPTSAVPTYEEILAVYDEMVDATAAATGAIAPAYSGSATYAVGDYCIHDGGLYRCTTAITTAEAWTAAHWTAAEFGPDMADLRSAFHSDTEILNNVIKAGSAKYVLVKPTFADWSLGYYTSAGAFASSTASRCVSVDVARGEKYRITADVKVSSRYDYVYVDIAGNVISLGHQGGESDAVYTTELDITEDGRLLVTTMVNYEFLTRIEKISLFDVQERADNPFVLYRETEISLTWTDGSFYNYDGTAVTNANWARAEISAAAYRGKTLLLTGKIGGIVNLAVIVDSGSNVIDRYGNPTVATVYNELAVYVPYSANKILFNTGLGEKAWSCAVFREPVGNGAYDDLYQKSGRLSYNVNWVAGSGYYKADGTVGESGASAIAQIDVTGIIGKHVRLYGREVGTARHLGIFVDHSGTVLAKYGQGTDTTEGVYYYGLDAVVPSAAKWLRITTMNPDIPISCAVLVSDSVKIDDAAKYPLRNKKLVFYGDSTTKQSLPSDPNANYPHWGDIVAKELGITNYVNLGIGGTMLATESVDSNYSTTTYPPGASDDRIATIPDDTDIITIMFGHNDVGFGHAGNGTTHELGTIDSSDPKYYYGAYNYLIQELYEKNPKMQIFILTSPYSYYDTSDANWHEGIELCRQAARDIAYKYSLPLIEMRENGINELNYQTYHSDQSHPNVLGKTKYAQTVLAKIKAFYFYAVNGYAT